MNANFHFQEWVFLAQVDEQAFERRRKQLIDDFLRNSGTHRAQLEVLQRKIDQQRSMAGSPEEVFVAISSLMCDSFCRLISEISGLKTDINRLRSLTSNMVPTSTTSFRRKPESSTCLDPGLRRDDDRGKSPGGRIYPSISA
ncbi:MAG: DUF3135 domain-containing protein [Sterolibacterium sp.]